MTLFKKTLSFLVIALLVVANLPSITMPAVASEGARMNHCESCAEENQTKEICNPIASNKDAILDQETPIRNDCNCELKKTDSPPPSAILGQNKLTIKGGGHAKSMVNPATAVTLEKHIFTSFPSWKAPPAQYLETINSVQQLK